MRNAIIRNELIQRYSGPNIRYKSITCCPYNYYYIGSDYNVITYFPSYYSNDYINTNY